MLRFLALPPIAAIALLAACDGDANGPSTDDPTPVARVVLTSVPDMLKPGETARLAAVAVDAKGKALADRTIRWSSSEPEVATVTEDGRLTAAAEGATTITAASEGKQSQTTVLVTLEPVPVAEVQLRSPPTELPLHATAQFVAVALDASGRELTGRPISWTSSATDVATVSATGLVTALSEGTTRLTARSGGRAAETELRVTRDGSTVAKVVIVQGVRAELFIGATLALQAEARSANDEVIGGRPVTWTSTDTWVATVSDNGQVTAVTGGTALVIAQLGQLADTITVQVRPSVQRVAVEPSEAVVIRGETLGLNASAYGEGNVVLNRPIGWRSSDPTVVTVDASGRVTGLRPGTVRVIAAAEGVEGWATVTVIGATDLDLVAANGQSLPTTLFTSTPPGGATSRYDVHSGSMRLTGGQRYEQTFVFWVWHDGLPPIGGTFSTVGDVTRDPQSGEFLFRPDDPTAPAFRGVKTSDATLEVTQRYLAHATEATLRYRTR